MSEINDPYDEVSSLGDRINLSRFIEPTSIIALVTVVFYFIISSYNSAYFKELSISFYSLDLPFTFYLYNGQSIALALLLILTIYPIFLILSERPTTTKKFKLPYSSIAIASHIIRKYISFAILFLVFYFVTIQPPNQNPICNYSATQSKPYFSSETS